MQKYKSFLYFCGMDSTFAQNKHRCLIGLGANSEAETNLCKVRSMLEELFPDVRWSTEIQTLPHTISNAAPFRNQVGSMTTSLSPEELKACFKEMERKLGRTPEGKAAGIIPADIDLLQYDTEILKPEDLKRDYIQQSISELTDCINR